MLLKLGILMAGYFSGVLTCNILYRESFKKYTAAIHIQYKEALEKFKKEYIERAKKEGDV